MNLGIESSPSATVVGLIETDALYDQFPYPVVQSGTNKKTTVTAAAGMTSHGLRRILATELGWPRCCWFSSPADTIVSFARGRKSHKRNRQESRGAVRPSDKPAEALSP
jgi:hypothetical protein